MNAFEKHKKNLMAMEDAIIMGMIYRGCKQKRSCQFDEYLRNIENILEQLSLLDKSVAEIRASNHEIIRSLFIDYEDNHLRHLLILLRMSRKRFHPEEALH
jgi:hypothetical protein